MKKNSLLFFIKEINGLIFPTGTFKKNLGGGNLHMKIKLKKIQNQREMRDFEFDIFAALISKEKKKSELKTSLSKIFLENMPSSNCLNCASSNSK